MSRISAPGRMDGAKPERSRELLADRAYAELRDRIVTLRIPPGAPIDEDELGRELGIGRTPVREAIKRLALENLVTVFPRRGTFASEINITERAELHDLLGELDRSRGSDDTAALMELDTRVHRFIHRCAGNPYLETTLGH